LSNCTKLESIGNSAFMSCNSLTSVDLSSCTSLKSICSDAFYYCSGLLKVDIPKSVTSIGINAFYGTKINNSNIKYNLI
jgi:hypothetical protein